MDRKLMGVVVMVALSAALMGCAAKQATGAGASVDLVTEKPGHNCKSLGEAAGSQGGFMTGGYTPDKNLVVGARNDLRNRAAEMGGNVVWLQNQSNHGQWGGSGSSSSTVVGTVYRCS